MNPEQPVERFDTSPGSAQSTFQYFKPFLNEWNQRREEEARRLKAATTICRMLTSAYHLCDELAGDVGMRTYNETLELAMMCARNVRLSSNKQVARELWKMAQEYQAEAAKLPELGNPRKVILVRVETSPPVGSEDHLELRAARSGSGKRFAVEEG